MTFAVDIKDTEIVLRGGQMKKPTLVTGLTCRDGKKYIYLWKNSNELSKCFTGEPAFKRPLAKTMVFEKLAQARNVKRSALLAELANDGEVSGDELAPAADLDLDVDIGPKASAASAGSDGAIVLAGRRGNLRQKAQLLKMQLPKAAQVVVDVGGDGSPWEPWVLLDGASKAVAVEASPGNFQMLHDLVQAELATGAVKRKRYGENTERLQPKGPPRARVYAIGKRWVTKIKEPACKAVAKAHPERRPYSQSATVRTLKRYRTDESSLTPPAAKRRANAKSRAAESAPLLDCLET